MLLSYLQKEATIVLWLPRQLALHFDLQPLLSKELIYDLSRINQLNEIIQEKTSQTVSLLPIAPHPFTDTWWHAGPVKLHNSFAFINPPYFMWF